LFIAIVKESNETNKHALLIDQLDPPRYKKAELSHESTFFSFVLHSSQQQQPPP
jgi:hypothetical protein